MEEGPIFIQKSSNPSPGSFRKAPQARNGDLTANITLQSLNN